MTDTVYAIDYETFYNTQYSLKKMSTQRYVTDKRFDPYLVGIVGSDGFEYVGPPEQAPWDKISDGLWVSHNVSFDMSVHMELIDRGKLMPYIPETWHCTADLCAYLQLPRALDKAMEVAFDHKVDKTVRDVEMKNLEYHTCTPEQKQRWHDYALDDCRASLRLWNGFSNFWPEHERRLSAETREAAWSGVQLDMPALEAAITKIQNEVWQAEAEIPWVKDGHKPTSTKQVKEQCAKQGIPPPRSMAKDSDVFETWLLEYGSTSPWALAMGRHRQANKLLLTMQEMYNRTDADGIMRFSLKYFGASVTGRWSGDQSLNMQNLTKAARFGVNLRHMFKARPGKKLLIVDLSQIEPRCLAYLAGDRAFLDFVANGADCYEAAARSTGRYTDPRPLKDVDPKLRQFFKARVLGAGYGASGGRYKEIAKIMAGLDLTSMEANQEIKEFRRTNPLIAKKGTGLWDRLDKAIKLAANADPNDYAFAIPSGRELNYFDVQSEGRGVSAAPCADGSRRTRFWGSKLTENITQGMARDVFGHGILQTVDAGIPFLWHVHDELICEVDEADVNEAYWEVVKCLSTTPDWAPGLPLAAEGVAADCYGNH